ncbi:proteasome assembly chaperone [Achlya hypogyna]|uniref:Proteasome assembly chaperone 2 n=1 Tax=Achlya hypogyna TaxID=1202772 RepID=A0A1V9ZTS8_ACHHY|nr:proteasome assembly chaperone [Achlya hypogyna]
MEFFGQDAAFDAKTLFKDAIIVTPGISFANMGQLVVDLLVNSALAQSDSVKLVGHVFSKRVAPMAGSAAFASQGPTELCLNMEAYLWSYPLPNGVATQKVALIQQRTSILAGQSAAFVKEFVQWAVDVEASSILVLAGADNMLCHDRDMHVYAVSHRIKWTGCGSNGRLFNSEFLDQIPRLPLGEDQEDMWEATRGAGLAPLVDREAMARKLSVLSFVLFCAEGNNVPDAAYLASCVAQYLQVPAASFKLLLPPSWSHMFGRDPSVSLFL